MFYPDNETGDTIQEIIEGGLIVDANEIQQLISNLGFPIVACVALFYMNLKTSEAYNKTMEDMRDTINKNTETMQNILEHLKDGDK